MKNYQKKIEEKISDILSEVLSEKLHGGQHKLDVAKPKGILNKADFKKLGSKKKETKEEFGDYEGDEQEEHQAEKLSQKEPRYRGTRFASFNDEDWFDETDYPYTGEFDFDYDEEEFDEFDSFNQKYGDKVKWFSPDKSGESMFNRYKEKFGPLKIRHAKGLGEAETEEGNAFSGELEKARKENKKTFDVDGKTYPVKESVKKKDMKEEEKWIQKTGMKKGALRKKLGVPEGEKIPKSKLNSLKKELMKKSEGDKKLSASDSKLLKQVNLALTLGKLDENINKKTLVLSENELIDLIEKIVNEETLGKVKNNINVQTPIGLKEVEKSNSKTEKDNKEEAKEVTKKMKEYLKNGSKGKFEMNPKNFPKGNGELGEMTKKAYKPSKAVEEYIENLAYPGLENTDYDEIKPNDEWLKNNLVGSSKTGNNPEWANAVKTDVGEKANKKRELNLYSKEKKRSYNRVTQPVDEAGEGKGEEQLDSMFAKLESTNDKKEKLINEDVIKMFRLIDYNKKTQ
jgi:hypothetical protein